MVRTQIQLTEGQTEALRRLAAEKQVSVAELIRQSVDLLLDRPDSTSLGERRRRAIAVAGSFKGGRGDVSSEHDRYFAESVGE